MCFISNVRGQPGKVKRSIKISKTTTMLQSKEYKNFIGKANEIILQSKEFIRFYLYIVGLSAE